jgi:hypothetical protein
LNTTLKLNEEGVLQVAIKMVKKGAIGMQRVRREVLNLRLCAAHPHIITFRDVRTCFAFFQTFAFAYANAFLGDNEHELVYTTNCGIRLL